MRQTGKDKDIVEHLVAATEMPNLYGQHLSATCLVSVKVVRVGIRS